MVKKRSVGAKGIQDVVSHQASQRKARSLVHAQAQAQAGGRVEDSAKALEQTKALADTLAADKDGKFANSKFLQFISKMSRGEIILEGNEVSLLPYTRHDRGSTGCS